MDPTTCGPELIELRPEFFRRVSADDIIEDADIRPGRLEGGGHVGYPERRRGGLFERIGRCNDGDSALMIRSETISLINPLFGVG